MAGDLSQPESIASAMKGVEVAYYLVHSMEAPGSFEELDRRAVITFANSAREAGVRQIVYLSGLGPGRGLSAHLASRHEVGQILRSYRVVTTELRASVVSALGAPRLRPSGR